MPMVAKPPFSAKDHRHGRLHAAAVIAGYDPQSMAAEVMDAGSWPGMTPRDDSLAFSR